MNLAQSRSRCLGPGRELDTELAGDAQLLTKSELVFDSDWLARHFVSAANDDVSSASRERKAQQARVKQREKLRNITAATPFVASCFVDKQKRWLAKALRSASTLGACYYCVCLFVCLFVGVYVCVPVRVLKMRLFVVRVMPTRTENASTHECLRRGARSLLVARTPASPTHTRMLIRRVPRR